MIGILPAAGKASRINGLPKYLLPIRDTYLLDWHTTGMNAVGCARIMIGVSPQSASILLDLVPGRMLYLAQHRATMTQTVLSALNVVDRQQSVLFSMPDTYWQSPNVFLPLQLALTNGADVAVALFKVRPGQKYGGMCRVEGNQVVEVIDKPEHTDLGYIWGALAWKPAFWGCLDAHDPHVGYGLPRAIAAGMDVRAVLCDGGYWDCGTFGEYFDCLQHNEEIHAPA